MAEPVIQDDQISALASSQLAREGEVAEIDQNIRERFFRIYKPLRDKGLEPYYLARLASAIYYYRPLLARTLKPTHSKHVLEVGCGIGLKALAWSDLFASYTGIELNAEHAAMATSHFKDLGVVNARIICGNAEAVVREPEKHGLPQIDLLVLYAVLEHLTIPERRTILQLAQDIYLRGGHVLIAESPNRLSRQDQHSWQLPFAEWLPDEILLQYSEKSAREDLKHDLAESSPDHKNETLYRIGRGISFHEFECFWDKPVYENMSLLNDGYSLDLLNLNPFTRDEWELLKFFGDNDLDVHRTFSRYWIEGLFSRRGAGQVPKKAHYVPPGELTERAVYEGRRYYQLDEVTIGSEGLTVQNPNRAGQDAVLLIDISRSSGTLVVQEIGQTKSMSRFDLAKVKRGRMPSWHNQMALPLGPAVDRLYQIKAHGNGSSAQCYGALFV